EVVAILGEGTYGRVVECIDHRARDGTHVAVKIARNTKWSSQAAQDEIRVLTDIKALDPSNAHHFVQMLESFVYGGHVCIVFELLGPSTRDFMKINHNQPFSLDYIRQLAYQICTSVNFLHVQKLTHADLKPENIVFVRNGNEEEHNPELKHNECRQRNPNIKIVDFGLATYDHEYHSSLVGTIYYRAPEVVLGLGWSQPCDVWSIGCTLLEYYLGTIVFQARYNKEHLAMMERVLGPLPKRMINRIVSLEKRKYFRKGRLAWNTRSPTGIHISRCCRPLREFMTCHDSDHENLFDLIAKMLQYDPAKRISLKKAMKHPFFSPLKQ
ncbi:CLK1 kinase, partial [Geococcyx californianus]|nr:CLK1 kinase [Geococcyx californianus]